MRALFAYHNKMTHYKETSSNSRVENKVEPITKRKIVLKISIGIIGVIVALAIVALTILSNPKVKLGLILSGAADQINYFFENDNNLVWTQSHSSETEIDLGEILGGTSLDILTAYDINTGDGLVEISAGPGDIGIYLSGDEIAFANNISNGAFVVDTQNEFDLTKKTNLASRLVNLPINHLNDEEIISFVNEINPKIKSYFKLALKNLPKDAISKGIEKIAIYGKDRKTKYIEIALDTDEMVDLLEILLEEVAEDEELQDLVIGIMDYLSDKYDINIDTDDFEIDELSEDIIDELDYFEADDFVLKTYYKGNTILGISTEYSDYQDVEMMLIMARNKYQRSFEYVQDAYKKMEINYLENIDGITFELNSENLYMEMDISGKKNERDISGKVKVDGEELISLDGQSTRKLNQTFIELEIEAEEFTAEIEYTLDEVKKNKEYESEVNLIIESYGEEKEINIDQTLLFGNIDELSLGSWSKGDTYTYGDITSGDVDFDSIVYDIEDSFSEILE